MAALEDDVVRLQSDVEVVPGRGDEGVFFFESRDGLLEHGLTMLVSTVNDW